jgi:hypothetical protein
MELLWSFVTDERGYQDAAPEYQSVTMCQQQPESKLPCGRVTSRVRVQQSIKMPETKRYACRVPADTSCTVPLTPLVGHPLVQHDIQR